MLATVKVLQSKNASTGTMSMSKKLMAINDSFTASLAPPPTSCIPNGEVNENAVKQNNISNVKPNPCVAVGPPPPSLQQQKSLSFKDNPPREENKESNGGTHTPASLSQRQPPPVKPNSLILVPHQKSIHDMSNGGLCIRPLDPEVAPSAPRLVTKTLASNPCLGIAKEVQTLTSPVLHSQDCPLRAPPQPQKPHVIAKSQSSSDPLFSENSDDYLESNSRDRETEAVPEQKGERLVASSQKGFNLLKDR